MSSPTLSTIRLTIRERLLQLDRHQKRLLKIAADTIVILTAMWLAFALRLDDISAVEPFEGHAWLFLSVPIVSLPIFFIKGFYRSVMRYSGMQASTAIVEGVTAATVILGVIIYVGPDEPVVPRSVIFIYWLIAIVMLGGLRLVMRRYFGHDAIRLTSLIPFVGQTDRKQDNRTPVLIYGAGDAGHQLLSAIRMGRQMKVRGFLDDDPALVGRVIGGIKIFDPKNIVKILETTGAKEVLLAVPSASRRRRIEIIELLAPTKAMVRTIPGVMDLVSGKVTASDLRDVDIADLLGRDPVAPNTELFEQCVKGQVVMVTGAGGSIGSELCRQIVQLQPTVLILYEHSEFALYSIHQEVGNYVRNLQLKLNIVPVLGSIMNHRNLYNAMLAWKVDTVYHAAAYKHVPMVEHNVTAGIMNNVFGTLHTAQAAIRAQVKNFVLISTDKAVRPTNIMGSTKRMAELILQSLAQQKSPVLFGARELGECANNTRFTMVRFGNVLGSSGSVIPLFKEQIKKSVPITVTHPEITRYFMTIPEAAQLVIQAGSMGLGGDVFVLDMGEPVKIAALAEKMVQLSGLTVKTQENPLGDIEIRFTGLRPGEKLYEELLIGSNVTETAHPKIMRANENFTEWDPLKIHLKVLFNSVVEYDYQTVRKIFSELVEGFKPDDGFVDWVYKLQNELRAHTHLPELIYPMVPFAQSHTARIDEYTANPVISIEPPVISGE